MLPKFERPVRFDLGALPDSEDSLRELLQLESAEFEAVVGQPLSFDRDPTDAQSDVWEVLVDGSAPSSKLEAAPGRRLVLTLPSLADLDDGLNLLHSLAYSPSSVVLHEEATSYAAAFDRIHDEVANIYPYFELRDLDWEDITDRHRHVRGLQGSAFWEGAHEWIAELGDAHTQLLCPTPRYHPPYIVEIRHDDAVLHHVPRESDAWRAGVRHGDRLQIDDPSWWLRTVGASPQHHAFIAGRRFLAMISETRDYTAIQPNGIRRTWIEHRQSLPSVATTDDTVVIRSFTPDVPDQIRAALWELRGRQSVTIDLRRNAGGNLVSAAEARRLFVRDDAVFGSVVFTTGRGSLAAAANLSTTPAADAWPGKVRVLVDAMTYSAAEDFLHPLVGAEHVTIVGGPTGGGSGRPHTRLIKDGVRLATSTAITYTSDGQPIEYKGIPSDAEVDGTDVKSRLYGMHL